MRHGSIARLKRAEPERISWRPIEPIETIESRAPDLEKILEEGLALALAALLKAL